MHLHFIIYCFIDHGLNQILEYKNVHLHVLQFLLLVHVFVYSQKEFMSCDEKIQSVTLDASLHDRVDHSMRNI